MSSKPKTAKEIAKEAEIYSVLREFFPEPNFIIRKFAVKNVDDESYQYRFRYQIISMFKANKLSCVFIKFLGDEDIYIDQLFKCGLNGRQTLDIIEKIAKQLNYTKISLVDKSKLQVYPEFETSINLYIYKILTNGQSWYNSLYYYSDNYEEELDKNAKFKTMTIKEFQEDVGSRFRNYTTNLNKLLTIFPGFFLNESEEDSMTVPEFYERIMEFIHSDEPDIKKKKEKAEWLENDLDYVFESNIITYEQELNKHIEIKGGFKKRQTKRKRKGNTYNKILKRKKKRKSYSRKRTRV